LITLRDLLRGVAAINHAPSLWLDLVAGKGDEVGDRLALLHFAGGKRYAEFIIQQGDKSDGRKGIPDGKIGQDFRAFDSAGVHGQELVDLAKKIGLFKRLHRDFIGR